MNQLMVAADARVNSNSKIKALGTLLELSEPFETIHLMEGNGSPYLTLVAESGNVISISISRAIGDKIKAGEIKNVEQLMQFIVYERPRMTRNADGSVTEVEGQTAFSLGMERGELIGGLDLTAVRKKAEKVKIDTTRERKSMSFDEMRAALAKF